MASNFLIVPNRITTIGATFLIVLCGIAISCERDTQLRVEGGNPPKFVMRGNGVLTAIRVRGPKRQRDIQGEAASLYWLIETRGDPQTNDRVNSIGSITYGVVPQGFQQVYPESGKAPPLIEGEHYYIRAVVSEANGDDGYFSIHNGIVSFGKYESDLPKK